MENHVKVYLEYFGIANGEPSPCERCWCQHRTDVHHCTPRGIGGDPKRTKDVITNLVGLCRACHTAVESDRVKNEEITEWAGKLEERKAKIRKWRFTA